MSKSKIEWTDRVWNPVRGCSRVSEGCMNCYAERQAARFSDPGQYAHGFVERAASGPRWTGRVELVWSKLNEPESWRKPSRVFVNSMSDLFHEVLPDEAIDLVFERMQLPECGKHTFQILTKRPSRMREYMRGVKERVSGRWPFDGEWPPHNVWLGVSVEDQETADARIPELLATPAAVRFVSAEPLLGPIDLRHYLRKTRRVHLRLSVQGALKNRSFDGLQRTDGTPLSRDEARAELESLDRDGVKFVSSGGCDAFDPQAGCSGHNRPAIDWLIAGGESGPGARPCRVEWIESLVVQCREVSVPLFVKQLGARPFTTRKTPCPKWPDSATDYSIELADPKGGDPSEWPEGLRVREFPTGGQA